MKVKNTFAAIISTACLVLGSFSAAAADSEVRTVVDDSFITTKVKAKMAADKNVSALGISVETKDGVVSLQGDVKSDAEAVAAIELAAATEGVKDVNANLVKVQPAGNQVVEDAIITAKVKGAFVREKLFGEQAVALTSVHVETKEGVVTLTGSVDNAAKADTAIQLTKAVLGVKDVVSAITVTQ